MTPAEATPPEKPPRAGWTRFFRREGAGLERLLLALVPAFVVGGLVAALVDRRLGLAVIVLLATGLVLATRNVFKG
jgi:hypothetical protein